MNTLGRLARAIRAQVNNWVQDAEDPEKILDQAVADMQLDLLQLRQAVAQAIATQKRTERQQQQTCTQAKEWYNRAQLALQKGNEAEAREALLQRQTYLTSLSNLETSGQIQQASVGQLKAHMRDLEIKIADARTRRDMYIARARSAEASQRIQAMIGQVGSQRSMGILEFLEDKVSNIEAKAEAMAELNSIAQTQTRQGQFASRNQDDARMIEVELSALKAHLSSTPQMPENSINP